MKNPFTEWKRRQKDEIITHLKMAYDIAEMLVKHTDNADASLRILYTHLWGIMDISRGKLHSRVQTVYESIQNAEKAHPADLFQAFVEAEGALYGLLTAYCGTTEGLALPFGLKKSLETTTAKMAEELLKHQAETKKQADIADKTITMLDSAKSSFELMANKLVKEITRVRADADMQAGYAYEAGEKAGKKEASKPSVQTLPTSKNGSDINGSG